MDVQSLLWLRLLAISHLACSSVVHSVMLMFGPSHRVGSSVSCGYAQTGISEKQRRSSSVLHFHLFLFLLPFFYFCKSFRFLIGFTLIWTKEPTNHVHLGVELEYALLCWTHVPCVSWIGVLVNLLEVLVTGWQLARLYCKQPLIGNRLIILFVLNKSPIYKLKSEKVTYFVKHHQLISHPCL